MCVFRKNLKSLLHNWFDYKEEVESSRSLWIDKQLGNYRNGKWIVGEGHLE